jgi:apolipoprotein N-acyltransferase
MAAPIRAVETARPVVQVTPTGISMLITSNGRMNILPSGQVTHIEKMSTSKNNRLTPYVRFGDWVIYVSALLLLGSITIGRKRKNTSEVSDACVNEG